MEPGRPRPGRRPGGGPAPCTKKPDKKYLLPHVSHMEVRHRHLAHLVSFRESPIVFFSICSWHRRSILAVADVHEALRAIWFCSATLDGWFVGRYIIMPDHVHLFARPCRQAKSMADWMAAWKSISSRTLSRALGQKPPIWQADYFDRYLRSADNYGEKWEYVRRNPVRAGLVGHPDEWPYQGVIHDLSF